jgi:hypothetical protein
MESRRVPVVRPPLHLHLILDPGPKHAGRLGSPNLRPSRPNLAPNWSEGARPIRGSERASAPLPVPDHHHGKLELLRLMIPKN